MRLYKKPPGKRGICMSRESRGPGPLSLGSMLLRGKRSIQALVCRQLWDSHWWGDRQRDRNCHDQTLSTLTTLSFPSPWSTANVLVTSPDKEWSTSTDTPERWLEKWAGRSLAGKQHLSLKHLLLVGKMAIKYHISHPWGTCHRLLHSRSVLGPLCSHSFSSGKNLIKKQFRIIRSQWWMRGNETLDLQ